MKKRTMRKILKASLVVGLTISTTFIQAVHTDVEAKGFKDFGNWISNIFHPGKNKVNLSLVEDESTVINGDMLRASTYNASTRAGEKLPQMKYFPVTLYNYDDKMNKATHAKELESEKATGVSKEKWEGIYFEDLSERTYIDTTQGDKEVYTAQEKFNINDEYVIFTNSGYWLTNNSNLFNGIRGEKVKILNGADIDESKVTSAPKWKFIAAGDNKFKIASGGKYIQTTKYNTAVNLVEKKNFATLFTIIQDETNPKKFALKDENGLFLNQSKGKGKIISWNDNDDASKFYLYKTNKIRRTVAQQSRWSGNYNNKNGEAKYGDYLFKGIVSSKLTSGKKIKFNYPEGGIFTQDNQNKQVYNNVGLPFVYTAEEQRYTFDASTTGAYFHTDGSQGTSNNPQSNTNLYFSQEPQTHTADTADGRKQGWFPFNDSQSVNESSADYLFGMNGSFPFTMTTNGRLNASDNTSKPITFDFSGDDDVWVFIDNQLVLDMGGIKNCVNGSINFAENTFTITQYQDSGRNFGDLSTGEPVHFPNKTYTGKLFAENGESGVLGMTRESFASQQEHNLSIFYLERGKGASNCKISFNLPLRDYVSVQKQITKSKDDDSTYPLTAEEQDMVNGRDFGFTLYYKDAPLANENYILYSEEGKALKTLSTDPKGHFTLRNGQKAKFIRELKDNENYYVVEDNLTDNGYKIPTFTGKVIAADTEKSTFTATDWTSDAISATGSSESLDSIEFVCENYLNATLPNPYLNVVEDKVVVDYGLKVELPNVLENDLWKGDSIILKSISNGQYGTVAKDTQGKYVYTLNKQITDVDVLTYSATVKGGNMAETKEGKIYIIPATTMYYEEDFEGLINLDGSKSAWEHQGSHSGVMYQETGIVGDTEDSPYGTDEIYMNNSEDSGKGTYYVQTDESNGAHFSYKFTGKGTTFFARTTSKTAKMRVRITDQNNSLLYDLIRDTSYKDDTNQITMYNIPVFTWMADQYGTYKVDVSLAKAKTASNGQQVNGSQFWLDGVRVYEPMDETSSNVSIANAAYAQDGEANLDIVTLRDKILTDFTKDVDGKLVWNGTEGQDTENGNFVLFTDSNGKVIDANEYNINGPKEEIYLDKNQKLHFALSDWDKNNGTRLYLGIKAPKGNAKVRINKEKMPIQNTVDCYYDITESVEIVDKHGKKSGVIQIEGLDGIISITNIKTTSNQSKFEIIPDIEEIIPVKSMK